VRRPSCPSHAAAGHVTAVEKPRRMRQQPRRKPSSSSAPMPMLHRCCTVCVVWAALGSGSAAAVWAALGGGTAALALGAAVSVAQAAAAVPPPATIQLAPLNIDSAGVVAAGLGNAADFAHQLHIAFSATVSGACIFSGQPFHCAVSAFPQDRAVWKAELLARLGTASAASDHCKSDPDVVDVGSLVDFPRRHCGQNPVAQEQCIDDVNYLKKSRAFVFRGSQDNVSAPGASENVVAFLAQLVTDPGRSIKLVRDEAFGHTLPLASTLHVGSSVSRAFPSCTRPILTEIYLCHACSCQEIEDGNARAGGRRLRWAG
jgi:hypothetical protein